MSNKSKSKQYVCIFDSSHFVDSQQKLIKHMAKCKSMEKQSYLLCRYNGLHWVKHYQLQQHQLNCQSKFKVKQNQTSFTKVLPAQISSYVFQMPFQVDMSMVQSSSLSSFNIQTQKQQKMNFNKKEQKKPIKKKQKQGFQKIKATKMWKQPNFQQFLSRRGYKIKDKAQKMQNRQQPVSFLANNDSFL